jgi:2-phosphosulfolactate phosphatase
VATPNDLAIVCSGDGGGNRPSVEDVYTAGALVTQLVTLEPALELAAGARLALRIHDAYATAADAFADAPHADNLRRLGLQADLDFAADLDVESALPVVARDPRGRLRIIGS